MRCGLVADDAAVRFNSSRRDCTNAPNVEPAATGTEMVRCFPYANNRLSVGLVVVLGVLDALHVAEAAFALDAAVGVGADGFGADGFGAALP